MLKQTLTAVGVVTGIIALLFLVLSAEKAFMLTLFLFAMFLILLVLVQRGRGGGLAGAFGGAGGSSAFGAKAGDNFTRITVVAASMWIVLCVGAAIWSKHGLTDKLGGGEPVIGPVEDGAGDGAGAGGDAPEEEDS